MRPLNNKHFGPEVGKIAVKFHNGTSVVTGYVVRQTGTKRFVCATSADVSFIVTLAESVAAATTLTPGFCTIEATAFGASSVEHVTAIQANLIVTAEGNHYTWKLGTADVAGQAGIAVVAPPAPPAPPAPTPTPTPTPTDPGDDAGDGDDV